MYISKSFNCVELKNRKLEVGQCDTHPQDGSEEWSRELQASQPDFNAEKSYGRDYLKCNHISQTGQPGNQAQPQGV